MLQHLSVPLLSGVLDNLAYISQIHNLLRGDLRHACPFRKRLPISHESATPQPEFCALTCARARHVRSSVWAMPTALPP